MFESPDEPLQHDSHSAEAKDERALLRIQRTLGHFGVPARPNFVAVSKCSAIKPVEKSASGSPPVKTEPAGVTVAAFPAAPSVEVDVRVPVRDVTLFPLFIRPLFPCMRVRSITKGSSQSATVERIRKLLDRLSTDVEVPASAAKQLQNVTSPSPEKRTLTLFSGPIVVTERDFSDQLARLKSSGEELVAFCLGRNRDTPVETLEDIHLIGVLARIDSVDRTAGATLTVLRRVTVTSLSRTRTSGSSSTLRASLKPLTEEPYDADSPEVRSMCLALASKIKELVKLQHPLFQDQLQLLEQTIHSRQPSELADVCACLTTAKSEAMQAVLSELNVPERLRKALMLLTAEAVLLKLVQQQGTAGGAAGRVAGAVGAGRGRRAGSAEAAQKAADELREKLEGKTLPEHAQRVIDEELARLGTLDSMLNAQEFYSCRNYLNWLCSMPWGVLSQDTLDIGHAEQVLEDDHFGLEEVKARILELIAVASIKSSMQGKILCLTGPPGVGKTSLGKSIARALNRKFYRFSVGGMSDVFEIKGHRRTYVGALPGKMVHALKTCGTANPVILIDEIDKMGRGWRGDPASALLEALDPEQNANFTDNYLDVAIDLSKVLFICTANELDTIPRPLLDRMEVLKLPGYFLDEKKSIARQYLIPKLQSDTGLSNIQLTDEALHSLISEHCREAGVRSLQKQLEKIFRKIAYQVARGNEAPTEVGVEQLERWLGKPRFRKDRLYSDDAPPGVVSGLAFNQIGGSLVWIETVAERRHLPVAPPLPSPPPANNASAGGYFVSTGQLGDVMKESTEIAYTFARTIVQKHRPDSDFFDQAVLHIHFPEGATPKDGPSAGVAIVTSFVSLALGIAVPTDLAMTGEITLTGRVLPVGGIREKLMAAKRSGMTKIILPRQNVKDFEELPQALREGLTPHFVENYAEVFDIAFGSAQ